MTRRRRLVLGTVLGVVLAAAPSSVRASDDHEVRKSGSCSGTATWEMRARWDDDARIELRGRVEDTRSGQMWAWKIKHNGWVSASGSVTTSGSSGSFEIRRSFVDLHGTDHFVFRAVNPKSGEVCRDTVSW